MAPNFHPNLQTRLLYVNVSALAGTVVAESQEFDLGDEVMHAFADETRTCSASRL